MKQWDDDSSLQSAAQTANTHPHQHFCSQGLITVRLSFPQRAPLIQRPSSLPLSSSSSSVPSPHWSCFCALNFVRFKLEQTKTTNPSTPRFVLPAPPRCDGDERRLSLISLCELRGDRRDFEQLCAGRSSFLGLQRQHAVKKGSVWFYKRHSTGRSLPCLIRFLLL